MTRRPHAQTRIESDATAVYAVGHSALRSALANDPVTVARYRDLLVDRLAHTTWCIPGVRVLHAVDPSTSRHVTEEERDEIEGAVGELLMSGFDGGEETWPDAVLAYDYGTL
jgi:hypothetical protein